MNLSSKIRLLIFMIILLIVSIICLFVDNELSNDDTEEEIEKDFEIDLPKASVEMSTNFEKIKIQSYNATGSIEKVESSGRATKTMNDSLTEEDELLLAKLAMAEAEGESLEGKALVILVVLNRVKDDRFPDTIRGVIYQSQQFSPVTTGAYEYMEPNDECYEALELVKSGWDESKGALYFESCEGNPWEGTSIIPIGLVEGGHEFYK